MALLRNYSGLFNDFCYIDESFIAQQTGLVRPELYLVLKELDRKHIVNYIPEKSTPMIHYLQRREESRFLEFPPMVYAELKQRFEERIEKMIAYATSDNKCRSRMLLRYFGEETSHDCGQCDVCLDRKGNSVAPERLHEASRKILSLLADGQPHHVSVLHAIALPYTTIEEALRRLVSEEKVIDDDGMLSTKKA